MGQSKVITNDTLPIENCYPYDQLTHYPTTLYDQLTHYPI